LHLKPNFRHRLQLGFASSHLTRRFLGKRVNCEESCGEYIFRYLIFLHIIQPVLALGLLLRCLLELAEAASNIGASIDVRSHGIKIEGFEGRGRRRFNDRPVREPIGPYRYS
jgi:hypothetical protein